MKNMKLVLSLSIMFLTHFASAEVLLDCTIPSGDTQGATVVRDASGKMKLKEITSNGEQIERSLYRREWREKKFRLHVESTDARSYLYKDGSDWWFEYRSNGFNIFSEAQCD